MTQTLIARAAGSRRGRRGCVARARGTAAPLDLVVDAPDVLADHPDRDELDAAEEEHRDHRRGDARDELAGDAKADRDRDGQEGQRREDEAHDRRDLQRGMRERRDRIQGEAQHLAQRVLRRARVPRGARVRDGGLGEPDPDGHPAQVAVALAQGQQRVERAPVEQPEVAGVLGQLHVGDLGDQAVEHAGGAALEAGLALALGAHGIDHVGPGAPAVEHLEDDLGRVLEVGVHHHHGVARRVVEARRQRGLVAEVARELDDLHAVVAVGELAQDGRRGVRRAVVDHDELERQVAQRGAHPGSGASRAVASSSYIGTTTLTSPAARTLVLPRVGEARGS
jgi:hypothetical protein